MRLQYGHYYYYWIGLICDKTTYIKVKYSHAQVLSAMYIIFVSYTDLLKVHTPLEWLCNFSLAKYYIKIITNDHKNWIKNVFYRRIASSGSNKDKYPDINQNQSIMKAASVQCTTSLWHPRIRETYGRQNIWNGKIHIRFIIKAFPGLYFGHFKGCVWGPALAPGKHRLWPRTAQGHWGRFWRRSRDRCESDMCGVFAAVTDVAFTDVMKHGRNKRPETSAVEFTEGLRNATTDACFIFSMRNASRAFSFERKVDLDHYCDIMGKCNGF